MKIVPRPLLLSEHVFEAKKIGSTIRNGEVAALVGAGFSVAARLPSWQNLVTHLILAWKSHDPSPCARRLKADNYIAFVRGTFGNNDLAFVSYLRRTLPGQKDVPPFGELLFRALYSQREHPGYFIYPVPSDLHRHLVALLADYPGHLWTTNYDDLLERAAGDLGVVARPLDLIHHRVQRGLVVTHLHGYLPPVAPGGQPTKDYGDHPVVLAEDDYHAVAANRIDTAWITHAFNRLFEEHHVLILGMSLVDPNLRRVLATLAPTDSVTAIDHHAVMTPPSLDDSGFQRIHAPTRKALVNDATRVRSSYWGRYGLGVVDLAGHDQLLPFIMRLRYESYGAGPGDLWREASRLGWQTVRPWDPSQQTRAAQLLADVRASLTAEFSVTADEVVDIGIFLVHPDDGPLELVFRAGQSQPPRPSGQTFEIDPDAPTGVAGCAFVSGAALRMDRDHVLYDYHASPEPPGASAPYGGLVTVPLVKWQNRGVPLGIIYLTTKTTDGRIFKADEGELAAWLQQAGNAVVEALQDR